MITETVVSVAYTTTRDVRNRARARPRDASELLELAYEYVLEHGVADLSLRPLAAAVNSSPRVLLFLFGSKAELVQAILARARDDELTLLDRVRAAGAGGDLDRARLGGVGLAGGRGAPGVC